MEDREVTAFRVRDRQRNMSAPRTDTALRGDFEYLQILRHFQSIDPAVLADGPEDDRDSPTARLAKLAFSASNSVHYSFALQTLYQNAKGADDLIILRDLAGSADIYGRLAKAGLSERIGHLETMLEGVQQQAAQIAQEKAALSHRAEQLEAELGEARQQAAHMMQASARTEAELARLLGSRSWRYTEGLRSLFGVTQSVRGKVVASLARNSHTGEG